MMTEASKAQAAETRARNTEARTRKWLAEAAAKEAATAALQRVMESEDATVEQVLESAKLLVELGRH